jgi:predicted extracellular nuclease
MAIAALSVVLSLAVRIHDVQGAGHRSPLVDQVVEVEGVVTHVAAHAFYMQDAVSDADDATSEGVRVSFEEKVTAGDLVRVSGVVREVRPGCSSCAPTSEAFANLTVTEIGATEVLVLGHADDLPAPVRIGEGAGERRPPGERVAGEGAGDVEAGAFTFDPARNGLDFYESLEGMRVLVDRARAVGPTVRLAGRGAEVAVVANDGARAGRLSSRGGVLQLPGDDNPERILVTGVPDLDVGDVLNGSITGVVDYAFGNFELVADEVPLSLWLAPPRAVRPMPAPNADELSVATFNLENLGPASDADKLERIAAIVVAELGAPDVLVLQEIQDDSGPLDDGTTDDASTRAALVDAIATAGGPAYAVREVAPEDGQDGGQPGANIRIALLVREDRGLRIVDRPGADARTANVVHDGGGAPELAWSPGRIAPGDPAFTESRKPVALELRFGDRPLFVVGVHFNSRLGDAPLFGRFQPPPRPTREQRQAQALVVASFVRQLLTIDAAARVVVTGDMNDDAESPVLTTLEDAGLERTWGHVPVDDRYTYVFQGNSEAVDHVLVSHALARGVVDARVAHANADFAHGASDHDPVAVRMSFRGEGETGGCRCGLGARSRAEGALSACLLVLLLARRGHTRDCRGASRGRSPRFLSGPGFSGKDRRP